MLSQIVDTKRQEVKEIPDTFPEKPYPIRSLSEAILNPNQALGLIAEVKKASPSKGLIRKDFDPVMIAKTYEKSGAHAISVLTDRDYFQGAKEYLTQIREMNNLPLLRKDFIIDPIQVKESRAIGADAILLIQAILEPNQAKELYLSAKEIGLEVLMEVHSVRELETVLDTFTPDLLGINNRDLRTFETNVEHTQVIAQHVPKHIPFISESGIASAKDISLVKQAGAKGILVGETLMRATSITDCISSLFGENT
ncbi:indole-3-glycerol phosphate synthase TrpC [Pseudalkalibacillus sp. SCS-8]|uniref:indole-3-glycerol phosphate synthase TrpC n=1 Tax=Pseudalkalibacillus nanhaiensis TaxID=3115291 RepID=UPI0032D9D3B1